MKPVNAFLEHKILTSLLSFGAGPNPTVLPQENVTLPGSITIPPELTSPPVDDWRDQLEDLIFSNDSCLTKDLLKCPERKALQVFAQSRFRG